MKQYIAIDLGASSGRIIVMDAIGHARECCRFATSQCSWNGRLCWDHDAIFQAIQQGLRDVAAELPEPPAGISCDSWAQDMVLLGCDGAALMPPVCYLDSQLKDAGKRLAERKLPELPDISSIVQLTVLPEELLKKCSCILHIADYINYRLSGAALGNYSMYSAGKLLDSSGELDRELLERLQIPLHIFPEQISGKVLGYLDDSYPDILRNVPVISGISHDTAAAFYALEPQRNEAAVILGTWLMCGSLQAPGGEFSPTAKVMGITPEISAVYTAAPGLWAHNQCIAAWKKSGVFPGFPAFDAAVAASDYCGSFEAVWSEHGVSPEQVAEYCIRHNWPPPQTPGDLGRALNAGTANSLQQALNDLQNAANTAWAGCVIGGGGIKNQPLMTMIQQNIKCSIRCGTTEASAAGNVRAQLRALQDAQRA